MERAGRLGAPRRRSGSRRCSRAKASRTTRSWPGRRGLVDGWLGSELCAEIRDARVRPEAPFVLPLGGTVLRGNIDLLATPNGGENGDGPIVVDFKTDRVGSGGVEPLGERYASQRAVYALAVAGEAGGGRAVRTAHVFLERPDEPVVEVFDEAALATARGEPRRARGADPRGVVRGHGRAVRRALLRLPRGPAPVPAPRMAPVARRPRPGPMTPDEAIDGERLAVFGYGSLVSRASIAETLGHEAPAPVPARLAGWRRRWSVYRVNTAHEKAFERVDGEPFEHIVGPEHRAGARCARGRVAQWGADRADGGGARAARRA